MYTYRIEGDGFTVEVRGNEKMQVGGIVQGIMDATLGTGESIKVTRLETQHVPL